MLYKLLFIILVFLGFFLFLRWKFMPKRPIVDDKPTPASWYQSVPGLFTPAEQLFLSSLEIAVEGIPVKVFGKVRIADIIKVKPGLERGDYSGAFSKIRSKHVDFVLTHPLTTAPLLVIELDDSTHDQYERKVRDAFVDEAMYQAKIPILHVPLRKRYHEQNLRAQIVEILRENHDYRFQEM